MLLEIETLLEQWDDGLKEEYIEYLEKQGKSSLEINNIVEGWVSIVFMMRDIRSAPFKLFENLYDDFQIDVLGQCFNTGKTYLVCELAAGFKEMGMTEYESYDIAIKLVADAPRGRMTPWSVANCKLITLTRLKLSEWIERGDKYEKEKNQL